ncbi:hypothetical protein AK830_g3567 [Neonectria ditissima]|uniref:Uncharacterized protein n=1 Tax=Neonectria ditissima TaxID=78410 RepID=A0A0P7B8L1_9HYPO|nr:hypothetical protein AK830_g3567 [Neonectria ditissima]
MPSEKGQQSRQDGKIPSTCIFPSVNLINVNVPAGASDKSQAGKPLQTDQDDLLAAIGGWSWEDAGQTPMGAARVGGEDNQAVTTPREGVVAKAA